MKLPKSIDQYIAELVYVRCRVCQTWDVPYEDDYDYIYMCNICEHLFYICGICRANIYLFCAIDEPKICMLCHEKAKYIDIIVYTINNS